MANNINDNGGVYMRKIKKTYLITLLVVICLIASSLGGNYSFASSIKTVKEKSVSSFYGAYNIIEGAKRMMIVINQKGIMVVNRVEGSIKTDLGNAKLKLATLTLKNGVGIFSKGLTGSITKKSNGIYIITIKTMGNYSAFRAKDISTLLKDKRVVEIANKEKAAIEVSKNTPKEPIVKEDTKVAEKVSPEIQKIADLMKTKVIIEDDITLFTLFAFMNFTGYDDENNKNGFHPVRQQVREDLRKMNLKLMDNEYFKNRKMFGYAYIHVLALMDTKFNYQKSIPQYLSNLSDLNVHLKEFYEKASIPDLYEKYKAEYQTAYNEYGEKLYILLAKMVSYLRIDPDSIKPFYFSINLLESYERGNGLGRTFSHKSDKGIVMTGPGYGANYQNVIHEFLHGVTTPINNKYRDSINQITYLKSNIPYSSSGLRSYQEFFSIYDESMIRSLDSMFIESNNGSIEGETKIGFVYTKYFNDKFIKDYPGFNGTLEEFLVTIINDLKSK